MRNGIIAIAALVLLVFGCVGMPSQPTAGTNATQPQAPVLPGIPGGEQVEQCTPSNSFSDIPDGTLSRSITLVATLTCAAGKSVVVKLDGETVGQTVVQTNATTPVNLDIVAKKDGTSKITVEIDGQTVLSKDWSIKPLGSSDTKGLDNDGISFKEWRALGFDVDNPIRVARVRMFLKRMSSQTQPSTQLVLELRSDNNGNPGTVLGTVKRPITVVSLDEKWVNFDFDTPIPVSKGKYWAVLRIEQSAEVYLVSDVVNLRFVPGSRENPGNDYSRQMLLSVDTKTGLASETQWTPVSYEKTYSVTFHAAK